MLVRRSRRSAAPRLAVLGACVLLAIGVGLAARMTGPAPSSPPAGPAGSPGSAGALPAMPLDVDPDSYVATALAADGSLDDADRSALGVIAAQPVARWISEPADAVAAEVAGVASGAAARGALPVLVAYAIPDRDCGSHSAGGAAASRQYRAWVDAFVAGLGRHPSIVVVEPDALAQLDCLSPDGRLARLADLRYAVRAFAAQGAFAYVDAGHAGWIDADEMASRLREIGVTDAAGFSLNVSNFQSTSVEAAYGRAIARALGGDVSFVIDTSRNGVPGDGSDWCNPPGRALGAAPTTDTGIAGVDAFLWVKTPGRSDGPCNGGPPAGQWWPAYALALVRNAEAAGG
ncbi:glycoside hydrolase family 6 protein [Galbitalea sp. SE-J8]|uniref:glycoside hydrolase family 6 protein n=1 Tax=Galbitalea sp. SE-J8 TaxID=3054952 RepID=UPI00259CB25B|nr:glycoside hydrolase family 6 protein [Galbitalea sp. SE-J8]MDM4763957.1 glycoside hydrolase family 6 protein [Galbitalea sp. SE-J8]